MATSLHLHLGTEDYINSAYDMMWDDRYVKAFYEAIPTIATWDDHDYGENDGVVNNPIKAHAKQIFFQRWDIPFNSPRRTNPDGGIYMVLIIMVMMTIKFK